MKIGLDTTFLVEVSIREHDGHTAARAEMMRRLAKGDIFVIAPQVLPEFVHVVTDARRFERPLSMVEALEKAESWWNAREVEHVSTTPESMLLFWKWMKKFDLGRKRLLDTMLAATYYSQQIDAVLTSNARDYRTFGCFQVIVPRA